MLGCLTYTSVGECCVGAHKSITGNQSVVLCGIKQSPLWHREAWVSDTEHWSEMVVCCLDCALCRFSLCNGNSMSVCLSVGLLMTWGGGGQSMQTCDRGRSCKLNRKEPLPYWLQEGLFHCSFGDGCGWFTGGVCIWVLRRYINHYVLHSKGGSWSDLLQYLLWNNCSIQWSMFELSIALHQSTGR